MSGIDGDDVHLDINLAQTGLHEGPRWPRLRHLRFVEFVEFRNPIEVVQINSELYDVFEAKASRRKNCPDIEKRLLHLFCERTGNRRICCRVERTLAGQKYEGPRAHGLGKGTSTAGRPGRRDGVFKLCHLFCRAAKVGRAA